MFLMPASSSTTSRNCDFELKNRVGFCGRGFIAGARYEPTTYQIFVSGSARPTIDKSQMCKELQKFAAPVNRQLRHSLRAEKAFAPII